MKYTKFFLPFLSLFFLLLFIQPVGGLGFSSFDLGPDEMSDSDATTFGNWFVYHADPGDIIKDKVRLSNNREIPLTFTLDAVDAITIEGGGFGLLDAKADNNNLGSWVELETNEVTLAPGETRIINFTITVPENAEVGDHIGGLVTQTKNAEPEGEIKSGGGTIKIQTRVGSRIYLTVSGDIVRDFKLVKRSFLGRNRDTIFRFNVHNLGNIRTELEADIKIYGLFGLFDEMEDVKVGEIFPKEKVLKELVWQGKERPLFGPYFALMTIKDVYEPVTRADSEFFLPPAPAPVQTWAITFFIPYTQTAVVVILLFLAWFLRQFIIWRKMVTLTRLPMVTYKVKTGDHLMGVAGEYGVDWKLVAKINSIKPPYSLHQTKELHIPDARGTKRDIPMVGFWNYATKPFASLLKHRVKSDASTKVAEYTIVLDRGDTQKDIEDVTDIKWAEIAKHNHLKNLLNSKLVQS